MRYFLSDPVSMVRTVWSHSKRLIHWISVLLRKFVLCSQPNVSFLMLNFRRKVLSQSAGNVHKRALLESVGLIIGILVNGGVKCPVTTSPVEQVTGVAKRIRLLPMYSAK